MEIKFPCYFLIRLVKPRFAGDIFQNTLFDFQD